MVDISIYRGILTGYNKAFLIGESTRRQLISDDPRSADILKPVLRGRDIQRYRARWAGLWLITTLPSLNLDIDDYPAVKRHLLSYGRQRLAQTGERLPDGGRARKKTPHRWFELQDTCAYHAEFSQKKLFWMDLTEEGRFAYSKKEQVFCLNSAYILSMNNRVKSSDTYALGYLCATLNSTIATWFIKQIALNSGMGVPRWIRSTVEQIPIPCLLPVDQRPFANAADRMRSNLDDNPNQTVPRLQADLDRLVYDLYGLTEEEIRLVKESSP